MLYIPQVFLASDAQIGDVIKLSSSFRGVVTGKVIDVEPFCVHIYNGEYDEAFYTPGLIWIAKVK